MSNEDHTRVETQARRHRPAILALALALIAAAVAFMVFAPADTSDDDVSRTTEPSAAESSTAVPTTDAKPAPPAPQTAPSN